MTYEAQRKRLDVPNAVACALLDCNVCLDSDIFDLWRSCGDCNVTKLPDCQMVCQSCIAGEGTDTVGTAAPRADQLLTIPAVGCSIERHDFQLACREQSIGNCGKILLLWVNGCSKPHCMCYNT